MGRAFIYFVLTFCMATLSHSVLAEDDSNTHVVISINVCEKNLERSRPKILAELTIATVPGQAFSFESGGSVKANSGEDDFDIGTRVNGNFERNGTGTVRLALKIRIGSTVLQKHELETELFRTETVEIRTVLRPGETKCFDCSASQSCEVTVEPLK